MKIIGPFVFDWDFTKDKDIRGNKTWHFGITIGITPCTFEISISNLRPPWHTGIGTMTIAKGKILTFYDNEYGWNWWKHYPIFGFRTAATKKRDQETKSRLKELIEKYRSVD